MASSVSSEASRRSSISLRPPRRDWSSSIVSGQVGELLLDLDEGGHGGLDPVIRSYIGGRTREASATSGSGPVASATCAMCSLRCVERRPCPRRRVPIAASTRGSERVARAIASICASSRGRHAERAEHVGGEGGEGVRGRARAAPYPSLRAASRRFPPMPRRIRRLLLALVALRRRRPRRRASRSSRCAARTRRRRPSCRRRRPRGRPPPPAPAGRATWEVVSGEPTFVGYRVREEFVTFGVVDAVGRTGEVTGTREIDGDTVEGAELETDMTTLRSDESRRDNALRGRGIETDRFPTARFELTGPFELSRKPVRGARPAHAARRDAADRRPRERPAHGGDAIELAGSAPIDFARFGIEPPSVAGFVTVRDTGRLEFELTARAALNLDEGTTARGPIGR